MSDTQILAAIVGGMTVGGALLAVGCFLAGHGAEIRAGWADGLEWLAARYATAQRVAVAVAAEVVAFALWVREDILVGPGHHRAEVAS